MRTLPKPKEQGESYFLGYIHRQHHSKADSVQCDRKLPECSTCKAAGAVCVVVDRLTNRQHPRGHLEGLESEIQSLNAHIKKLESEADTLRRQLKNAVEARTVPSLAETRQEESELPTSSATSPFSNIAEDVNVVSHDVTSGRRYIGDSSGLFFGNIVQAILLQADYKGEQGPSSSSFRMRVGDRQKALFSSSSNKSPGPYQFTFPDQDLAYKLQNAYFKHRWPSLPFMHHATFLENHYNPSMNPQQHAGDASQFLTFMVFALGAIDLKRQNQAFGNKHLEYFQYATQNHLQGMLKEDSIETVQGLLLIAQFAVNEHQSANAWLVTGQAVRTAIDLGLHRSLPPSTPSNNSLFNAEMRKRVFWSTYALDRNVSIALGRPCALRDEDIDIPLPQNFKDTELVGAYVQLDTTQFTMPQPLDMSTFVHIIKLRQLQSRIQSLFYSPDTSQTQLQGIHYHQAELRSQLDSWITQSPRYSNPTVATFQSTEWFQIAYSHALLLLYRPSPANPVIDSSALQICADSAISLISSYSSLYAKNKITYTWIALHSLFMASITMLYTLCVSPDIRASTTKAVVKSNVISCLALFEVMSEYWPLASRCHEIIDRLGSVTVALFERSDSPTSEGVATTTFETPSNGQHFGQIDAEFMEWFGTRNAHLPSSAKEAGQNNTTVPNTAATFYESSQPFDSSMDIFSSTFDFFPSEFDTTIPMMMTAFNSDPHMPRPSDASEGGRSAPSNM